MTEASHRTAKVKVLVALLLIGGFLFGIIKFAQTPAQMSTHTTAPPVATFAFANASPLLVFDSPGLRGGRKESFEFGRAYEVEDQTADYVKLKLQNGASAYLHSAHVTTIRSPRWLVTTPAYNTSERGLIRFWENAGKLKETLAGMNTGNAWTWDYEEFFDSDSVPQFPLRLPILEADAGAVMIGGSRKIFSVMLPISQAVQQAFENVKSDFEKKLDLYLLVDVSGSTNEFLEETMGAFTRALIQNNRLRNRVDSVVVATFGASQREKSRLIGKLGADDLAKFVWHRPRLLQTSTGEREPLIDGLLAITRGIRSGGNTLPVLLILSGSDVELASYIATQGKSINIEDIDVKLSAEAAIVFAQVTPEPGDDLRNASRQLTAVSRISYLEYSDVLADNVVSTLIQLVENQDARAAAARALSAVSKEAHANRTMAFLPRVLNSGSSLPVRQKYADSAEWYTARLWLAVYDDLMKESAE